MLRRRCGDATSDPATPSPTVLPTQAPHAAASIPQSRCGAMPVAHADVARLEQCRAWMIAEDRTCAGGGIVRSARLTRRDGARSRHADREARVAARRAGANPRVGWVALPDADRYLGRGGARWRGAVSCVTQAATDSGSGCSTTAAPVSCRGAPARGSDRGAARCDGALGEAARAAASRLLSRTRSRTFSPSVALCQPYETRAGDRGSRRSARSMVDRRALRATAAVRRARRPARRSRQPFSDSGLETFVVPRLRWMRLPDRASGMDRRSSRRLPDRRAAGPADRRRSPRRRAARRPTSRTMRSSCCSATTSSGSATIRSSNDWHVGPGPDHARGRAGAAPRALTSTPSAQRRRDRRSEGRSTDSALALVLPLRSAEFSSSDPRSRESVARRGCRGRPRAPVRAARPGAATASRRAATRDRGTRRASSPRRSRCSARSPRVSTSSARESANATRDSRACGTSSVPIVQSATSEVRDARRRRARGSRSGCRAAPPRRGRRRRGRACRSGRRRSARAAAARRGRRRPSRGGPRCRRRPASRR